MTAAPVMADARSLPLFTAIPAGMRAVQVRRRHHGSPYHMGMFVIVDPADTAPADGVDFLVRWSEINPPSITGVCIIRDRWFVGPAGGGHSLAHHNNEARGSFPIRMVDGPYKAETLQSKLLGRVMGYLGHECGRPIEALWPDTGMEGPNRDVVGLEHFPDHYVATGDGTCLEPVFPHGAKYLMSTLDPVDPGDYVVLFRMPELTRASHRQCLIKRLVSPLPEGWEPRPHWLTDDPMPPVVLVETHNPPRTYAIPADELMTVHKCLGIHDGPTFKVTKDESKALAAEQRAARGVA